MRPRPSGVDELRAKLRALGYLDAGVDRFVLGPARGTSGIGAIAARSSARIGLLAGILLGPAAAIGIALRLPGLVTGPADALVVALYLGALFGLAAAAAAFCVAVLAVVAVRRAGQKPDFVRRIRYVTLSAGVAVSLASLTYLTLWWRATDARSVWTAPLRTVVALAVSVAISLLLGHAVRVTALALVARSAEGVDLPPLRRRGRWKSVAAGLAVCLGAAALLFSMAGPQTAGQTAPSFAVQPTGLKVQLIAIDGFDAGLYSQLAAEGRIPTLRRLLEGAVARVGVRTDQDPVRVWTTVATGQPSEVHGIESLEMRRVAGIQGRVGSDDSAIGTTISAATDLIRLTSPAIASGADLRTKTFWEVAAERGFRVAVINWWATWPAVATDAIVVTDRAPLRLERGGPLNAEIAPADLYQELLKEWPDILTAARQRAEEAFPANDPFAEVLRRSAELDAVQFELFRHPALGAPDLVALYLPGLDIAQHALLGGKDQAVAPSDLATRLQALNTYYEYLDHTVAARLGDTDPNLMTLVVTHPGRVGGGEAMLVVRGPAARPDANVRAALVDVAPTVLFLLGMPISQELEGSARLELLTDDFVARHMLRTVASYGSRRSPQPAGDRPLDDEMLDRLRSLGYVR